MDGGDRGHDADLGPRVGREFPNLAEAPHRQLENAELGVLLETTQRQRDPELVVEAALGGDCAPLRRADRAEQILRRRLADRARDRDDAGARAVPDPLSQGGERGEWIVGYERRRGAARQRVLAELRPGPDRDEEVALLDPS